MDKILILQLVSILQFIAIIVLAFTVNRYHGALLLLHKALDTFVQDIYYGMMNIHRIVSSDYSPHSTDDPLDVVNAHPKFDDLGIDPLEK